MGSVFGTLRGVCALFVLATIAASVPAGATHVGTLRISTDSIGGEANGVSSSPSVSADGRLVVWTSSASDLVPDDTNEVADVFAKDLETGTTVRVSVGSDGLEADGPSFSAKISASGHYVAFDSTASNLVDDDTNDATDVFVRDLESGTTTLGSAAISGAAGDENSTGPDISEDGRFVVFTSRASNLTAADANDQADVFLRDMEAGTTTQIQNRFLGEPNHASGDAHISDDGSAVAFTSHASNLVPADSNGSFDAFVWVRTSGAITRISVSSGGVEGISDSWAGGLSSDGRVATFWSYSSNLVLGDLNMQPDVFVRDLMTATTTLESVSSSGAQANGWTDGLPSTSHDGRYVFFSSAADNMVPGDTNGTLDVFIRDRVLEITSRISLSWLDEQANWDSYGGEISADGFHVAFGSGASNLVPDDANAAADAFLVEV